MGLMGQPNHPEVEAELQRCLELCVDRGVPCVGAAFTADGSVERAEQGFQIIVTWPERNAPARIRAAERPRRP
jgi:hypothetical protein